MNRTGCIALICLLAASCGPSDNDPGPGGVTVGEARALDEAAEMLEERQDLDLIESAAPQPENDGTAQAPDPAPEGQESN